MKRSRLQTGMTLIELMVALAIGMFLMIGAMTVFMQGRSTFRLTEAVARLQENGRFALDTLELDVRMAQYWGLTNRSERIRGRATESPIAVPATTLDDCGANWLIDLDNAIAGWNNRYTWPCAGNNVDSTVGANPGSDSFVVRRVAENSLTAAQVAAAPGTLFVQSSRGGTLDGQILLGAALAGFDPVTEELHQLVVNGYYVSTRSSTTFLGGTNVPSLRMWTLAGSTLQDRELIPGVEDMQLQFGIDTDPPGAANRGSIDRYVNPEDPLLATSVILAVRVWLRIRAERIENGFVDGTTYNYADENVTYNDNFRRVVVSKTIYLRNARI